MSSYKKVFFSPLFGRKVKKLNKKVKEKLDEEIRKIVANPIIGEEKKGDLRGVRVHKFKIKRKQILLAYKDLAKDLLLLAFGSHEIITGI